MRNEQRRRRLEQRRKRADKLGYLSPSDVPNIKLIPSMIIGTRVILSEPPKESDRKRYWIA